MKENYDLIILGLARWDNTLYSSILGIAKEFAKTNRVFYIDRPFSYKDYLIEKELNPISIRKEAILHGKNIYKKVNLNGTSMISVTPKMSIPINFLPEGFLYEFALKYNKSLVSTVIEKTIQDYNIQNYVYFNSFLPSYFDIFNSKIKAPILKIYRSSDDISQEKYIAKHGIKKEKEAIEKADILFTSSFKLAEKLGTNKMPAHRIPNAVDPELFSFENELAQKPIELLNLNSRIILFMGRLSKLRIDFELLKKIASEKSEYTLVLIGTYDQTDLIETGLINFKNILFVGPKPAIQLKNYLAFADCAIIPFLKNTLTESIYPLKINEYLLFGLPIISSNFSQDIRTLKNVVYLSENHDEFIQNIDLAMNDNSEEKRKERIQTAQANTWQERIKIFKKLIKEKIEEKGL
ncbi:MAG: glycosyltransferase [Bacteroidia bacterium]